MSHVELSAVIRKNSKTTKRSRFADISRCGGLFHGTTSYAYTAKHISKLPWCERVVATYVVETNVGTWRNGKKS